MIPLIILTIEDSSDRAYMEDLYLSYNRLMYSEIYAILHDVWATEDVLHSVIVKLIGKIPLLRTLNRSKLINYIITACKNTSYTYLHTKKREAEFSYDDDYDSLEAQDISIDDRLLKQDFAETVHAAWKELDERSRRVLEMKYILEQSNEDIAEELGIKPSSVRMILTRARKNLSERMKDLETA